MSVASAQVPALSVTEPAESLWPEASEMDATLLDSTAAPPSSMASSLWDYIFQWVALFRGLTLAAASAVSGAVAATGFGLLLFLLLTTSLAPASDTFTRPLTLDYSPTGLVAEAVFLPEGHPSDGLKPARLQSDARFLAPQQAVDVWAELLVPRSTGQGLAQVVAQLASVDGHVAAKSSKMVEMRTDWWTARSLLSAPLRWLGLASDMRRVRVPLFTNFHEKRDVPFTVAHVAVKTRSTACSAAEVESGVLKVRLRLGWLRRAVYWLRPGRLALALLGLAGIGALMGGGAAAFVFLALLLWAGFSAGSGREAEAGTDELGSVAGSDDAVSVSGVSDASSSLLRDLSDEEGEPPAPRQMSGTLGTTGTAAGFRPGRGRAAVAGRGSEELLSMAGTSSTAALEAAAEAADKYGGRPKSAGQARAGRPADSAMGSEAGAASGGLAGILRRRMAGGAKPSSSQ